LPETDRLFGEGSRLEPRDVVESIIVEAGRCAASEVRVYTGGAVEDWDLGTWAMDRHMLRQAANGVKVTLVVPEDVLSKMEWDEVAALRARVEAAHIQLALAPTGAQRCGAGWLLAEVGGPARSVRWAVTHPNMLLPDEGWGDSAASSDSGARIIRVTASGPLPALSLRQPRRDELDKPRPGLFTEITVRGNLDGDLAKVGTKFWSELARATPGIGERLTGSVPLAAVTYEERFIVSPLNAAVVYRVLSELGRRPGGITATTAVTVRTASSGNVRSDRMSTQGSQMFADWLETSEQTAVLVSLFVGLGVSKVTVVPRRGSPHFRELTLKWLDGRVLLIRLDHGLSFLRTQGYAPWRFGDPAERQAAAIRNITGWVRQEAGSVVPLYVSGPT
jgi:hypothetical protein